MKSNDMMLLALAFCSICHDIAVVIASSRLLIYFLICVFECMFFFLFSRSSLYFNILFISNATGTKETKERYPYGAEITTTNCILKN